MNQKLNKETDSDMLDEYDFSNGSALLMLSTARRTEACGGRAISVSLMQDLSLAAVRARR